MGQSKPLWIQSNSLEWASPDTDSCFLSSWWSSFWSYSDSQRRSIQKPSVPHQCVIAQRSRNEQFHISCNDHRKSLLHGPSFSPTPVTVKRTAVERKVASGCLNNAFVTLGITVAPVVDEQLGILFLAFNHFLSLWGILKVLYWDKNKVGRVSFIKPITRKSSIIGKDSVPSKRTPVQGQGGQKPVSVSRSECE